MEWEYEIKFKFWNWALARKKDKFALRAGKKWQLLRKAPLDDGKFYWSQL